MMQHRGSAACPSFWRIGVLATLLIACPAIAQNSFIRTYGSDTVSDQGYCVIQTADGGYYLAGLDVVEDSVLTYTGHGVILRVNADGDELWRRAYGEPGMASMGFEHMIQTSDGHLLVTGFLDHGWTGNASGKDTYIAKLDTAGNLIWTHVGGQALAQWAFRSRETPDGGSISAGSDQFMSSGQHYASHLVRLNDLGDTLWTRSYHNPNPNWYQNAYCVEIMPDSGYVLAGKQRYWSLAYVHVIRTNSLGDTLWTKRLEDLGSGEARDVVVSNTGNILITGYGTASGYSNPFLTELDPDGNVLWSRIYDHAVSGWSYSLCKTQEGYALFGLTYEYKLHLIHVDLAGDTLWSKQFEIGSINYGHSVIQTTDGGFAMTGITGTTGVAGSPDMFLIKTDASGNVLTSTHDVASDPSVPVVLFPNPTHNEATVQFTTPDARRFSLQLRDVHGRVIKNILVNEHRGPGQYRETFDLTGLAPGSYYVVLSDAGRAVTVKVLKL